MTIWDKNMAALDGRYSYLRNCLETGLSEGLDSQRTLAAGTEEVAGRKILYVQDEEQFYQLDTLYDVGYLSKLWFATFGELAFAAKTVMFGLGNGMFARAYLEGADETAQLLVYEPSGIIFRRVMEEFDLSDILSSERIFVLVEGYADVDFSLKMKEMIQYTDVTYMNYRVYLNYDRMFPEESRDVHDEVQLHINAVLGTQDVMARHGESYFTNTMVAFSDLINSKSLFDLKRKLPVELPVFIVASGPSLDKNMEELKRIGDKGLVLAADSAVPALVAHGIIPHMYASIDGEKHRSHFESGEEILNIPVICELTSAWRLMLNHKGIKFVINNYDRYIFEFFRQNGLEWPVFESGGSVAHILFELSIAFGFKTIVLVGQDLAYTDNKTHSSDTFIGKLHFNVNDYANVMVEGYDGGMVRSSEEFRLYLRWFEGRIRECPHVRFMNATEGGAKIHGAEQISLKEAISSLCTEEYPVKEIFTNVDDMFDDMLKQKLLAYIRDIPRELEKAGKLAKAAIRDYEKILLLAHQGKFGSELRSSFKSAKKNVERMQAITAMEYVYQRNQKNVYEDLKDINRSASNAAQDIILAANQGIKELSQIVEVIDRTIPDVLSFDQKQINWGRWT